MLLRDKCWLWGHPEGRYNHEFGNENESRMTPMEGCLYLGIRNTFMVPDTWKVNRRQYNKSFQTLKAVGWECLREGKLSDEVEAIIQEAKEFPNIDRTVLDDFKGLQNKHSVTLDDLHAAHRRLQENEVRPLSMWMVLYTHEFGIDPETDKNFLACIEPFDGVIMWNWKECNASQIPEKYEIFKELTKNKRRMFGCYLYNFGESKQATGSIVKWQLDWYREKLLAKEAEGIVLHTNTMADLDYEAYDAACEWMAQHGDDEIPD